MKAFLIGAVVYFYSSSMFAQQPQPEPATPPTVEQCQTDRMLWWDAKQISAWAYAEDEHLDGGPPNETAINKLTFREVNHRAKEMNRCQGIDPDNKETYFSIEKFYARVISGREEAFIKRHGLVKQMVLEDDAGAR